MDSAGEMRRVGSHVLTELFGTPPRDMDTELSLRSIPSQPQMQMVAAMPTRGLVHSSVRLLASSPQGRREGVEGAPETPGCWDGVHTHRACAASSRWTWSCAA